MTHRNDASLWMTRHARRRYSRGHDFSGSRQCLSLSLDPYLSRKALKTHLHADYCTALLASPVAWHLVVVHVSDTAVTCEKESLKRVGFKAHKRQRSARIGSRWRVETIVGFARDVQQSTASRGFDCRSGP